MRSRHPLAPLAVPALLAAVTAFALLAALLSDGALETLAVVLLGAVVGLAALKLLRRSAR